MYRYFLALAVMFCTLFMQSAHAQTPTTWRTSLDTVNVRLMLKDTAFALAVLNRLTTTLPDTADVWYARATLFAQMGRFDDVIVDCSLALQKKELAEYALLKSEAEQALKQPQAAIKTLSSAIAAQPKSAVLYYFRGMATMKMNDPDNALFDFSDAIMLDPTFADAYLKRGMANVSVKRTSDAVQDFDSCIALDPTRAEAYFLRGSVRIDQGKKQEAAKDLIKAGQLGYRTSTDLLRGYLADVVPKSTIDSLQTYTMKEVAVVADREPIVAAKEDIRAFTKRVPSIIRAMIGRSSTRAFVRPQATFGGGSGIVVRATDMITPPTAAMLENKPTSQITLNELVTFYRNRVALLDNQAANKLVREIMNLQQSVALSSNTNERDNAIFIRENLMLINARIQELSALLDKEEQETKAK